MIVEYMKLNFLNTRVVVLLVMLGVCANVYAQSARPVPSPPQLGANSYILCDFNSERILVEHNADMPVEQARITKLMTAYVVFDELKQGNISLDDVVPISERAWRTGGHTFENEYLTDVAAALGRRYNARLTLSGDVGMKRITYIEPQPQSLTDVLTAITQLHALAFRKTANGYEVYTP